MKHILLILTFCTAAAFSCAASALYVDDNAPNDPAPGDPLVSDPAEDGSQAHPFDAIQQAINAADPNFISEVIILPGTYTGEGNRDIDFKGKPITVRGINPDDPNTVAATIIDCQGTEAEPHRGFYFHSGETESSALMGLTITRGYAQTGGGILCDHSNPTISHCIVVSNVAGNQTYFDKGGGGILCSYSDAIIIGCVINDNIGGGVLANRGSPKLAYCSITNNRSMISGGGIRTWNSKALVHNCSIVHNNMGGLACYYGACVVTNCHIRENFPTGVFAFSGTPKVARSIICANTSPRGGAGMSFSECAATVTSCTIVGNRAETEGGGIFIGEFGEVTLSNSIVWGNSASEGQQIHGIRVFGNEPAYSRLAASYCDIQGGISGITEIPNTTYEVILDLDPLFADPGRWDDNATPNDIEDDRWIDGDYHLKSYAGRWDAAREQWVMDNAHSPCIDAGDPASDYSLEPAYNGGRINMGTYGNTEYASKSPNCPEAPAGDLDGDCKVTFADFAIFAANWLDCNLDPPIACE